MRGFRWTLINDESVTSFAATPWIPKKELCFLHNKKRKPFIGRSFARGFLPKGGHPLFFMMLRLVVPPMAGLSTSNCL